MSGGLSAARIGRVWLSKRKAPTSAPRAMKRQRIGKYPQITQITQIFVSVSLRTVMGPNKAPAISGLQHR